MIGRIVAPRNNLHVLLCVQVRSVLLRGLASFPTEAGMLCMLLDAEQFSTSQQRLVHHMFEVRPEYSWRVLE